MRRTNLAPLRRSKSSWVSSCETWPVEPSISDRPASPVHAVSKGLTVRVLRADETAWLREQMVALWGSPVVLSRGRTHDASRLSALICEAGGETVGLATYDVRDGDCELVTIDAFTRGRGIGTMLLDAVIQAARQHGCRRLWLITSNDNLSALRFYQRRGLQLVALHRGAIDEARRVKPEIPLVGDEGIPIHDELELELQLEGDDAAKYRGAGRASHQGR